MAIFRFTWRAGPEHEWHLFCCPRVMYKTGKIKLAGYFLILLMCACRHKGPAIGPVVPPADIFKETIPVGTDTIFSGKADTTIDCRNLESVIIGHISANKGSPTYTLQGVKGQRLIVLLKAVKKGGNVRINQIRQPGGTFDGPFGDSLNYFFPRTGNLSIIVGENTMAGDPYDGDFVLRVKLK